MGYKDAQDVSVASKILAEIDVDNSGVIDEDEFVTYFLQRRLEDLEKRLREVSEEGSPTGRAVQWWCW